MDVGLAYVSVPLDFKPQDEQAPKLEALLPRAHALVERHLQEAEPLVMEALVLCVGGR